MTNEQEKIFLVFNTACIGDMLVTNALVQNIKFYYPNSKVVFVCNKPFVDVAKYQQGVDKVVVYDKKECKTLKGLLKFVREFPYKHPYASIVTYANERNLLISRLLGAKHILSNHRCKLWNTKEKYEIKDFTHIKEHWSGLIDALTGEHKNLAIKYNAPEVNTPVVEKVKTLKNPVVLCTTSNFYKKDMKVSDCANLISLLNQEGFTPVLTGAGNVSRDFSVKLRQEGCFDFINLVDCTSFVELANILKTCRKCITVDTGTLHFANALQVPVVGIFYDGFTEMWAPDESLYPAKTLDGYTEPEKILEAFKEVIK